MNNDIEKVANDYWAVSVHPDNRDALVECLEVESLVDRVELWSGFKTRVTARISKLAGDEDRKAIERRINLAAGMEDAQAREAATLSDLRKFFSREGTQSTRYGNSEGYKFFLASVGSKVSGLPCVVYARREAEYTIMSVHGETITLTAALFNTFWPTKGAV